MTHDLTVGFVCVRNAGRSQMATAYAERELDRRGLDDRVRIVTGGTQPADSVHDVVARVMAADGIDVSDRVPRQITTSELEACDVVATMGCSTLELDADVAIHDWALDDPGGASDAEARRNRDEVRDRVRSLFDDLEEELTSDPDAS